MALSSLNAEGQSVSGLMWVNENGGKSRFVKTSSFSPRQISFAPDGTLWVAGRAAGTDLVELAEYDVLRRYAADGSLLGSALPRSLFPSGPSPALEGRLAIGKDRITLLSAKSKYWADVSLSGQVLAHGPVAALPGQDVAGAAVVGSNFFVSAQSVSADASAVLSTEVFRLSKSTGTFEAVNTNSLRNSGQAVLLLGIEEDRLVVRTKPSGHIYWASIATP